MNSVELLSYSLDNAFGILSQVMGDLTQEQADWQPPGIANPAGALYWHTLTSADYVVHQWCMGEAPLSERGGWQEEVLVASLPEPDHGADQLAHREYMCSLCVDLPAAHQYAQALGEALRGWLGSMTPEDLDRTVQTPVGELNLAQLLETFVIWHINAHCGEIAALKGCQGARGYPF